jgi:hypothetical protein
MGRNVEIYTLNEVAGASEMLLAIFGGTCCHLWSSHSFLWKSYIWQVRYKLVTHPNLLFTSSRSPVHSSSYCLFQTHWFFFFSLSFPFCFLVRRHEITSIHLALMLHLIAMYHFFLDLIVRSIFSETMIMVS